MVPGRLARLVELLRSDLARRGIMAFVLALGTALLVMDYVRVPHREYHVGEVLDRDVRATTSFQFVDEEATAHRQAEAEDAVLPVFDYDATLGARLQSRISEAFDRARRRYTEALVEAKAAGKSEVGADRVSEIAREFLKKLELSLDPADVQFIVDLHWSQDVEDQAKELLAEAMRHYVIADRTLLPEGARALEVVWILRDTRDEIRLDDFSQIQTPSEARQAIRLYAIDHADPSGDPRVMKAAVALAKAAVRPNFSYNQLVTENRRRAAREKVPDVVIHVERGTSIAREGDVLTRQQVQEIRALQQSRSGYGWVGVLVALVGLCALIYISLYQFAAGYIRKFSTRIRDLQAASVLAILVLLMARALVELAPALARTVGMGLSPESLWYLLPFAGGAMLVRILVNSETSLVWILAVSGLVGVLMDQEVLYAIFFAISGVTATVGIAHTKERVNVLRAGVQTGLLNAAAALLIDLIRVRLGDATAGNTVATQPLWDVGFAIGGGALSAILVLGLVPIFEQVGFVTDYKLLELANLNHPLLRQLMLRAPGTYHHSVIVGSLSESAAEAIGANALLARVCCYFHDIGKAIQPRFFIENQRDGLNPHDKLEPHQSARVIVSHVVDGAAIARQYKLPAPIVDGILMHHGTGLIQYFYARAVEQAGSDEKVDEAAFRYPGKLPDTREQGIILLADRVEAACRTLKNPTAADIRQMIQKLVNQAIVDGQLEVCPLTVKELYKVVDAFTDTLLGIYHHRIEYPGLPEQPKKGNGVPRSAIITLEIPNPLTNGGSGDDEAHSAGSGEDGRFPVPDVAPPPEEP